MVQLAQMKNMNAVITKDEAINLIQIVLHFFDYTAYVNHRPYWFYFIKYFFLDRRRQTNGVNNAPIS
jgi:hypothetical protein